MSLQNKFLIIFGILFISFAVMQYTINRILIVPSFINLENDEAIQNLNRVNEAINKEIERLDDLCHDWGSWDDSCAFMEKGSEDYEEGNLSFGSFVTANLNIIYYLTPTGDKYWGKIYDLNEKKDISLEAFSGSNLAKLFALSTWDPTPSYQTGIISTEKGPLMLAARPILTTENQGPARGTIVMGRFLTKSLLNQLAHETKVNFSIHEHNPKLPLELKDILDRAATSYEWIKKENPNNLFMYNSFPSIEGPPAFLIEVIFPREISKQGLRTIQYSLFFLVTVGLIILLSTLMLIRKIILKPLEALSRHIKQIENGDYTVRLRFSRKDAIGKLAQSFDTMVEKIELQTEQLETLSSIDSLTGIFNRRIFDVTLVREWKRMFREKQYLSLILCDVDYFKLFNDTYGHQKGDTCLQQVAGAIKSTLRRPPDFLARYGGEEFVVLLPNTPPEGALYVAEQIRKKVHGLEITHNQSQIDTFVTLSLGVASIIPGPGGSPIDILETADRALYESKNTGRNTVVYKKISQNEAPQ